MIQSKIDTYCEYTSKTVDPEKLSYNNLKLKNNSIGAIKSLSIDTVDIKIPDKNSNLSKNYVIEINKCSILMCNCKINM